VIDGRIHTAALNPEQTLTKDTGPVNVDATIFGTSTMAVKAVLAIIDYR